MEKTLSTDAKQDLAKRFSSTSIAQNAFCNKTSGKANDSQRRAASDVRPLVARKALFPAWASSAHWPRPTQSVLEVILPSHYTGALRACARKKDKVLWTCNRRESCLAGTERSFTGLSASKASDIGACLGGLRHSLDPELQTCRGSAGGSRFAEQCSRSLGSGLALRLPL